jgi:hypothetical protein
MHVALHLHEKMNLESAALNVIALEKRFVRFIKNSFARGQEKYAKTTASQRDATYWTYSPGKT